MIQSKYIMQSWENQKMNKVIVVGAGAAGMMAAYFAEKIKIR